jgi:hypothetical protein
MESEYKILVMSISQCNKCANDATRDRAVVVWLVVFVVESLPLLPNTRFCINLTDPLFPELCPPQLIA